MEGDGEPFNGANFSPQFALCKLLQFRDRLIRSIFRRRVLAERSDKGGKSKSISNPAAVRG